VVLDKRPMHTLDAPEETPTTSEGLLLRRNWLVIAVVATAALAVLLFQAFLHSHLSGVDEYDDGVYFGASLELVHGVLPYKDFAFIQPPMITVWLAPFAALSSISGTAVAMEFARLFVDAVTVANVVLVGMLVRRRSTLQVFTTTGIMAFSQGTIRASQTVLLEPFLVFACLMGFLFLLEHEHVTGSTRRLWLGGIFLGIGGATKVWAVFPLLAILFVVRPQGMRIQMRIVGGALAGFLVSCAPFLVGAPIAFFQQVVLTQAVRNTGGLSLIQRVADLTGLPGFSALMVSHRELGLSLLALLVSLVAIGLIVVIHDRRGSAWSPLERMTWVSTMVIALALVWSPTYYYHYAAFLAPFLALTTGFLATRLSGPLSRALSRPSIGLSLPPASLVIGATMSFLLGGVIAVVATLPAAPQVGDVVSDGIPSHGCVLYANPTLAIMDNRYTGDVSRCPDVVDWLGQERVLGDGLTPNIARTPDNRLQALMAHWIASSDAVVLETGNLGLNAVDITYLHNHFSMEKDIPRGLRIFVRRRPRRTSKLAEARHVAARTVQ
jgi:alpha-1,2-mannosyltransferase